MYPKDVCNLVKDTLIFTLFDGCEAHRNDGNRYIGVLSERIVKNMNRTDTVRHLSNSSATVFSVPGIGRMKKIYCSCGCIIGLDSAQMNLKLKLGKELECTKCRNSRISRDIDEINAHFSGPEEESF